LKDTCFYKTFEDPKNLDVSIQIGMQPACGYSSNGDAYCQLMVGDPVYQAAFSKFKTAAKEFDRNKCNPQSSGCKEFLNRLPKGYY